MTTAESSWTDEASARLGGFADDVNARFKDASATLRDLDVEGRAFIKENPFVALAAAVLGGFLVGRLLARL